MREEENRIHLPGPRPLRRPGGHPYWSLGQKP